MRIAVPRDLSLAAFRRRCPGAAIVALGGETMGTSWSARIVEPERGMPPGVEARIRAALDGVVAEMSHWEADSQLSRFNRSAPGQWQALPPQFSRVLGAALAVAEASGGAFDPAMGVLVDLWGFGPTGACPIPKSAIIAQALAERGDVEHDVPLLRARRTGAGTLDFSGIAKGHAVDAMAETLLALGLGDFLVEIGGELRGEGIRPDAQPWWVDLEQVPGATALPPVRVALHGLSAATSGDYRRAFEHAGRSYAHTLDPRTGAPVENGVASVTVLHPLCMLADAWATALTVLGPETGPALAEREGLTMRMVVREGEGFRELLSPRFAEMIAY